MAPTVRALPGRLDIECRPGDPFALSMTFTTGTLTGATIAATVVNGRTGATVTATATKSGDVATVSLTDTQTTALGEGSHRWEFTVNGVALVAGTLIGTMRALSSTNNSVTVTISQSTAATVTVLGAPGSGGGGGGGAVDSVNGQTGTVTLVAADVGAQPVDSDLTAIAALSTTSYGRAFLALADAAAGRTALGLGTAATTASTAYDAAGTATAAVAAHEAASDPHPTYTTSAELTAALASYQPVDSDLTAIAALATTTFGRSLLTQADATAARSTLGVVIGTNVQAYDAELQAIAGLASNGIIVRTSSTTAAARTITAGSGITVTNGDGVSGNITIAASGGGSSAGAPSLITPSGGNTAVGLPGWYLGGQGGTFAYTANSILWTPIVVTSAITATAWVMGLSGATTGNVRCGLYAVDSAWMPTGAPLFDVAFNYTGSAALVVQSVGSVSVAAGRYMLAAVSDAAITRRFWRGIQPIQVGRPATNDDTIFQEMTTSFTYGALPTNPTQPTTIGTGTAGTSQQYVFAPTYVLMRWT